MGATITYTPSAASATGDVFAAAAPVQADNQNWLAHDPGRWDAKYGSYPALSEICGLIAGKIALPSLQRIFNCLPGLAVGQPVSISADNTVALALGDTAPHAAVIGFVAYKPTAVTCLLVFMEYVSGLSGLTAGGPVYLADDGSISAVAGSVTRIMGTAISTTEAILYANPLSAQL